MTQTKSLTGRWWQTWPVQDCMVCRILTTVWLTMSDSSSSPVFSLSREYVKITILIFPNVDGLGLENLGLRTYLVIWPCGVYGLTSVTKDEYSCVVDT
jgi:hypothetical protein